MEGKPVYAEWLQDRITRPEEPKRREAEEDETGPRRPDVGKPDTERLLKRMRRVDPEQAKRYRQRTGE
jgi:hypothetical protein